MDILTRILTKLFKLRIRKALLAMAHSIGVLEYQYWPTYITAIDKSEINRDSTIEFKNIESDNFQKIKGIYKCIATANNERIETNFTVYPPKETLHYDKLLQNITIQHLRLTKVSLQVFNHVITVLVEDSFIKFDAPPCLYQKGLQYLSHYVIRWDSTCSGTSPFFKYLPCQLNTSKNITSYIFPHSLKSKCTFSIGPVFLQHLIRNSPPGHAPEHIGCIHGRKNSCRKNENGKYKDGIVFGMVQNDKLWIPKIKNLKLSSDPSGRSITVEWTLPLNSAPNRLRFMGFKLVVRLKASVVVHTVGSYSKG